MLLVGMLAMEHWAQLAGNHKEAYQPRGTGIIILNQLAHQAQQPGDDKIGLGRWCWARLHGKDNHYV